LAEPVTPGEVKEEESDSYTYDSYSAEVPSAAASSAAPKARLTPAPKARLTPAAQSGEGESSDTFAAHLLRKKLVLPEPAVALQVKEEEPAHRVKVEKPALQVKEEPGTAAKAAVVKPGVVLTPEERFALIKQRVLESVKVKNHLLESDSSEEHHGGKDEPGGGGDESNARGSSAKAGHRRRKRRKTRGGTGSAEDSIKRERGSPDTDLE